MSTLSSLAELTEMVASTPGLYVRWSRGPDADLAAGDDEKVTPSSCAAASSDQLTGARLPGLSANPLDVEPWWGDRPLRTWVARRLYDYRHLVEERGPGTRPWVLDGEERGRGPDNEPLVACRRPIAWLDARVIDEAVREVEAQPADWGSLRRT